MMRIALSPKAFIFLAGSITPFLFWLVLPESYRANESSDFVSFYDPIARSLIAGNGLPANPSSFRYPPGYPLILSGVYTVGSWLAVPEETSLQLLNYVCAGLIALMVFGIGSRFKNATAGYIAVVLWCSYPFWFWLTKQPNSEIPFTVCFIAAILIVLNMDMEQKNAKLLWAGVAGSLLGFAMLIRPLGAGIPAVLALWLILNRQAHTRPKIFAAVLLLAGAAIVVTPWQIWLSGQVEEPLLLSSGGLPSVLDGLTYAAGETAYSESFPRVPADVVELMGDIEQAGQSGELNSLPAVLGFLTEEGLSQPGALIKMGLLKAFRSLYATDSLRFEAPSLAVQSVYLVGLVAAGVRMWAISERGRRLILLALLLFIYFWAMTVLVLSIVRYMVPVMALAMVVIGAAIEQVVSGRNRLRAV